MSSHHFRQAEFACPHCHVALVRPKLLAHLEAVRAAAGAKPIRIVSGYRCPPHNKAVGGAGDSQHMYAAAADIPPGHVTPAQAVHVGFTGIGVQDGWAIHLDVRDGPLATWRY